MKRPSIEVYKSKGGYRWRLKSINGRIVAESGEALTKKPTYKYFAGLHLSLAKGAFGLWMLEKRK